MRFQDKYGFSELHSLPGCNQLVVSTHAFIKKVMRGKGWGRVRNKEQLKRATKLGYDYILCTVVACNTAQIKILENNGWKKLDSFNNKVTENEVLLYGRNLIKGD